MQRRTSLAVLAFASSAALIAGCGSSSSGGSGGTGTTGGTGSNNSSQSPAAELTSAASALGKASTLTTSIKLGASASDISALAAQSGSTLSSSEASAIAGAAISVEISAPSGKTLSDLTSSTGASGAAVDFTVSDNGTNFLSIRSVNKVLYIQADLKDLFNAIGQSAAFQGLSGEVAQLPSFVQALVNGKWVSLPESALSSLTGGATSSTGGSGNTQQEQAVISGLKTILANDVTVTRTTSGSTDDLAISANARTIAKDFISTISSAVPAAGAELGSANPSNVPNKNINLTAQVTGGALSQVAIDLGQFDSKGNASLPLEVDFSENGSAITAPSGAVAVNTQELTSLFGSFAGGLGGAG